MSSSLASSKRHDKGSLEWQNRHLVRDFVVWWQPEMGHDEPSRSAWDNKKLWSVHVGKSMQLLFVQIKKKKKKKEWSGTEIKSTI